MKIVINDADERTVYPDIDENMTLDESKRFAVVLKRPSAFKLVRETQRRTLVNGKMVVEDDLAGSLRAYVKTFRNAPQLEINGVVRDMTLADLFEYDELSPIVSAITDAIKEMREAEADDSPKN